VNARRIAMWSGPRNISTAMMRAWENRGDCAVSDEPLYAHYLAHTGLDHPGADEVIAHGCTDWRAVVAGLTGPVPGGKPLWFQKHMTHHLLPHIGRAWVFGLDNVFLIRDPADVVESYLRKRDRVTPEDIGLPQQLALFEAVSAHDGRPPPVLDADDFLADPRAHLQALCARLAIPFTDRMLHWPAGPRASDGIWAPHWYDAVWRSTGFETRAASSHALAPAAAEVVQHCRPMYDALHRHRMRP
jgi:hypothetical protein